MFYHFKYSCISCSKKFCSSKFDYTRRASKIAKNCGANKQEMAIDEDFDYGLNEEFHGKHCEII